MPATSMERIQTALDAVAADIDWGNWEVEEVDGKPNSEGTDGFWKVTEVLHCKVEWLREVVSELETLPCYSDGDLQEHIDTIDQLQILLKALNEYEK